jgi:hypothetical protein
MAYAPTGGFSINNPEVAQGDGATQAPELGSLGRWDELPP